jgi:transglutaminase-like putative cysteine protease
VILILIVVGTAGYFILNKPNSSLSPQITPSPSNETSSVSETPAPVNPPSKNQNEVSESNKPVTTPPPSSSKYCFSGQCWDDNSSSIFQLLFGEKLNAVASNNQNNYIGPIIGGHYFDSAWFISCEPLRQKVNELISGKATNREKILAIANWVTASRSYGVNPAGQVKSICELYSAKGGVCLDAAFLTTAMLRFAGIPARVVDPQNASLTAHEYTAAFLDGKWIAIDSTFGGGEREIFEPTAIINSLTYYAFDKPKEIIIPAFLNPYNIEFTYYLADGYFVTTHTQSDFITENGVKKAEPYGTITYIKPGYLSQNNGYIGRATLIAKNLQCDYYQCRKYTGEETKIVLPGEYMWIKTKKMIHAVDGKITQQINNEFVTNAELRKNYYVVATFPAGQYRLKYESSDSGKTLAYYDFEIQSSGNLTIMPDRLIKGGGIGDAEFNSFIDYLKTVK